MYWCFQLSLVIFKNMNRDIIVLNFRDIYSLQICELKLVERNCRRSQTFNAKHTEDILNMLTLNHLLTLSTYLKGKCKIYSHYSS